MIQTRTARKRKRRLRYLICLCLIRSLWRLWSCSCCTCSRMRSLPRNTSKMSSSSSRLNRRPSSRNCRLLGLKISIGYSRRLAFVRKLLTMKIWVSSCSWAQIILKCCSLKILGVLLSRWLKMKPLWRQSEKISWWMMHNKITKVIHNSRWSKRTKNSIWTLLVRNMNNHALRSKSQKYKETHLTVLLQLIKMMTMSFDLYCIQPTN